MAVEERIDSLFSIPAIKQEVVSIMELIGGLRADLAKFETGKANLGSALKVGDIVSGVNASNDALKKFEGSAAGATTALKALKAEQVELRNEGARLANALKQQTIDARAKAAADKEAAAAAKLASKEAQEAGSERLRQLKAEQAESEKLAQIEADRAAAEAQQFEASRGAATSTGGSNRTTPGRGGSFNPSTELERQVNFLQKNQAALAANSAAQKQLAKDLAAGTITQAQYDEKITQAIILQNEYKESIALNAAEVKKLQNVNEEELRIEEEELRVRKELADAETRVSNFADRQFQAATASEQAALALTKNKEALAGVQNQRKIYDNALKEGNITQAQHARLINETVIKEQQYKAAISQNSAELKKAVELEKLDGTALRAKQLKLAELIREYGLLNAAQRASVDGRAKLSQITVLNKEVLELEKSTGRAQRNVGNYTNGIGKAFSALKTVANILPGIGIAGLFGLALDPLYDFIKGLIEANRNLDKTKEITDKAGDAFAKATASVGELKNNVELAKQGFIDKDKVVKEYNETIGKTAGQVKTLDEVEQVLTKNADAYVKFTLYKAAANIALEDAAKKAFEAEQTRMKKQEEFANALTEAPVASGGIGLGGSVFNQREFERQEREKSLARLKRRESEAQAAEKDKAQLEDIAKKFQDDAAKLAKDFKFNFFGDADEDAKKAEAEAEKNRKKAESDAKKAADLAAAQRKADLERIKKNLEDQKKAAADLFSNELLLDKQRVEARKIQSEKELSILRAQYEIDIANKNITNKQKLLLDEQLSNDRIKVQSDEDIALLQLKAKSAAKEKAIDKEINDQFNAQVKTRAELEKAALDARIKGSTDNFERRSAELEKANAIELRVLAQKRSEGLISEEEYNRKRERITEKTARFILLAQLDFAEENLRILKAGGQNVVKQEEEIAKIRLKIAEDFDKKAKKKLTPKQQDAADAAAGLNEVVGKFKEYYDQVDSIIGSALDASYTKQKNQIQNLIDLNEKKKNQEIEAVEKSTLSEQDKAAKISRINITAQAERERLELRQRQLDQKKAQYEKASKIAQITLNGALGVTARLAVGDFVGAVVAGALAAAQLAIAIATPIPKFRHGKQSDYQGPAIVDDGGKPEAITRTDGTIEIGGNTPRLTYLKAGDKVHPDADVFLKDWSANANKKIALSDMGVSNAVDGRLLSELQGLRHDVRTKPVPMIQNNMNGVKAIWANGNGNYKSWVQQNMQS